MIPPWLPIFFFILLESFESFTLDFSRQVSGDVTVLRPELVTVSHLFVRQSAELAAAVTHLMLKTLLDNHWHPSGGLRPL